MRRAGKSDTLLYVTLRACGIARIVGVARFGGGLVRDVSDLCVNTGRRPFV